MHPSIDDIAGPTQLSCSPSMHC